MTATVEIIGVLFVVVALTLAVIAVGYVVHDLVWPFSDDRQRLPQHTRQAEREITDISQWTQDAIIAELVRRSAQQHRVVDGQVIAVRDESDDPRVP